MAEFAIEFIHSVNQSPVREVFKAAGTEIQPVSVRFYSFGAGMQTNAEEGQTLSRDNDAMVITGFNHTFTKLNYTEKKGRFLGDTGFEPKRPVDGRYWIRTSDSYRVKVVLSPLS